MEEREIKIDDMGNTIKDIIKDKVNNMAQMVQEKLNDVKEIIHPESMELYQKWSEGFCMGDEYKIVFTGKNRFKWIGISDNIIGNAGETECLSTHITNNIIQVVWRDPKTGHPIINTYDFNQSKIFGVIITDFEIKQATGNFVVIKHKK